MLASDGVDTSIFRFQLPCFQTEDDVAGRIKTFAYTDCSRANRCAFTNFSKYPRITRICPVSRHSFIGYDKELERLVFEDYDSIEGSATIIGPEKLREPDKIFIEKQRTPNKKYSTLTVALVYFDTAELVTLEL